MPFRRSSCCLGLLALTYASIQALGYEGIPREDKAWKTYLNKEIGYCVSYPSRWIKAVGFEGTGISVTTGKTRYGLPIASLDITNISDEVASDTVPTKTINLSDDYETHLSGLKQFVKAEQIETLEEKPLAISGLNALFTRARYYDPKEKTGWIEEVVFTRHNAMTFRLELQTKASSFARFQPVFQRFVDSFQVECPHR